MGNLKDIQDDLISRKVLPYVWRAKLSQTEYEGLKDALKNLFARCNGVRKEEVKYVKGYAVAITVYVAEWFKREYQGNRKEESVFNSINIGKNRSENIWEALTSHINKDCFLYRTDQTTRYLDSIYVLGGLPLRLINANNPKEFIALLQQEQQLEESRLRDVFGVGGTAVLRSFIQEDGSLYQYKKYIIDEGSLPLDETDVQCFQEFTRQIEERYSKKDRNKFRLDWEACYYNQQLALSLQLTLSNNESTTDVERCNISSETARSWGVGDQKDLTITVKNGDTTLRAITFYKQRDGSYSSYMGYHSYLLATDIKEGYCKVLRETAEATNRLDFGQAITIACGDRDVQSFDINSVLRFRYIKHYRWTTSNRKGSLALFIPFADELDIQDGSLIDSSDHNESMWIPIHSSLSGCTYRGKSVDADPYIEGELIVELKELIHQEIIHYWDGCYVKYKDELVYLIQDLDALEVKIKDSQCIRVLREDEYTRDDSPKSDENNEYGCCYAVSVTLRENRLKKKTISCYRIWNGFRPIVQELGQGDDFQQVSTEQQYDRDRDLLYRVYVGAEGVYNKETKKILGQNSGVIKFLKHYVYRDANGHSSSIHLENRDRATTCVFNDWRERDPRYITVSGGIRIRPFSTREIVPIDGRYRIQLPQEGEDILRDCDFRYAPFCDLCKEQTVKVEIETTHSGRFAVLNFEPCQGSDGLLFQSLEDRGLKPDYYIRPLYIPNPDNDNGARPSQNNRIRKRNERIEGYREQLSRGNYDEAIRSFNFAIKHDLYFVVLDWLCALVYKADATVLVNFYFSYLSYCKEKDIAPDFLSLHRLSRELLFDWWMIPISEWRKHQGRIEDIEALLQSKPIIGASKEGEEESKQRLVDTLKRAIEARSPMQFPINRTADASSKEIANAIRNRGRGENKNPFCRGEKDNSWQTREAISFSFVEVERILNTDDKYNK